MATIKYSRLHKYKFRTEGDYVHPGKLPLPDCEHRYIAIKDGTLTIKDAYAWNGANKPAINTKSFRRGSAVHDALYQLTRLGLLDIKYRLFIDKLLIKICLEDKMWKIRTKWVYASVRTFGKKSAMPNKNPRDKIFIAP